MKLLVAYDGSEWANAAIEDLRRAGLPAQGEALVFAAGPIGSLSSATASAATETSRALMAAGRGAERVRAELPGWRVEVDAAAAAAAIAILERAEAWRADLIVVGSHGRSALGRAILGSVSLAVLTDAPCSVRIARRRPGGPGRGPVRLVVGVDGSVESAVAVSAVASRIWPTGSEARVVAVVKQVDPLLKLPVSREVLASTVEPPHGWVTRALDRVAQELREANLAVSPLVCEGDPKRVLVDESEQWDADCIFVGTPDATASDGFLGGCVARAVAARAHRSVEVVRQAP